MRGEHRAVAIVCVPCRRQGGFFVPTSELVLASLDGAEQRHPAVRLSELVRTQETTAELERRGVRELVLAVDDLAVTRSWMLPPQAPLVKEIWPALQQNLEPLFADGTIPCQVMLWSELLAGGRDAFEAEVAETAHRFRVTDGADSSRVRAALDAELRRRRRFQSETGRDDGEHVIRKRAVAQVANYVVQGQMVARWDVTAYVPWTAEEISLMSLREPRFSSRILPSSYGTVAQPRDPLDAFPKELARLAEELRLYVTDLPKTPGAVRPGLVTPLLDALGKLLTPGTRSHATRQIRAFNHVLPGGASNQKRVDELLDTARRTPPRAGWALEQVIKKLFCHLASRYTDEECQREHERHTRILEELAEHLPISAQPHVALALTGSLPQAPEGMWHPFFSDIDVMPLFLSPPGAGLLTAVRSAYIATAQPPWLYLNEGAREGVAGLTHDPVKGLFVADRLHLLNDDELGKLSRLVAPMRHIGGSPRIFAEFTRSHAQETAARKRLTDAQ